MGTGNTKQFLSGMKWTTIQQVSTQLFGYIGLISLAYLVSPDVFGTMAIASVWIGVFLLVQDFGVREHLIKDKELTMNKKQEYLGILISSAFLSLFFYYALGGLFQEIYKGTISIDNAIIPLGLLIIIRPIIVLHEGLRIREQNFKFIAINNIVSSVLSNSIGIFIAYFGYALDALIWKFISGHAFLMIGYLFGRREKIKPVFNKRVWRKIWHFSSNLTYTKVLGYLSRNADYLILGYFFSPTILGQYTIAYKIMLLPMKNISSQVTSVLLPMLSKASLNSKEMEKITIKSLTAILMIVSPLMILIAATSTLWANIIFPSEYTDIAEMLSFLCIVGVFQAITSPLGNLFIVSGKTDVMFKTGVVKTSILIIALLVGGASMDITIFLTIYLLTYILIDFPISFYSSFKVVGFNLLSFVLKIKNIIITSVLLFAILKLSIYYGKESLTNDVLLLAILSVLSLVFYVISLQVLQRSTIRDDLIYIRNIINHIKGN